MDAAQSHPLSGSSLGQQPLRRLQPERTRSLGPRAATTTVPDAFALLVNRLMDLADQMDNDDEGRPGALALLNRSLARDGFEAFYAPDRRCYLAHSVWSQLGPTDDKHAESFTDGIFVDRDEPAGSVVGAGGQRGQYSATGRSIGCRAGTNRRVSPLG
jgi:hypothetical protein